MIRDKYYNANAFCWFHLIRTHQHNIYFPNRRGSSFLAASPRFALDWGRVSCSWWSWWQHAPSLRGRTLSPPARNCPCLQNQIKPNKISLMKRFFCFFFKTNYRSENRFRIDSKTFRHSWLCSRGCRRRSHRCTICALFCAKNRRLAFAGHVAFSWHSRPVEGNLYIHYYKPINNMLIQISLLVQVYHSIQKYVFYKKKTMKNLQLIAQHHISLT